MDRFRPYRIFKLENKVIPRLKKAASLLIVVLLTAGLLSGCEKDDPAANTGPMAGGYSILVNEGNVLVSGFRSEKRQVGTAYWINGESADGSEFTELMGEQSGYRQAVDDQFRTVYQYKDREGVIQDYRFDQGSPAGEGRIFYYKNDSMIGMEDDSVGNISSVAFHDDRPYFAGHLQAIYSKPTEGQEVLRPETAFIWDSHSPLTTLALPEQTTSFHGVSTVYVSGPDDFYVGGLCGIPMYWDKTGPVVLDDRYGEVWQITKSGQDVYAAGLINKYNSNSTGHTACYWKNGELHELEDRAQAFGIYVDGDDVYVSGATGNVPTDYRPCYWKNGVRIDLPM